MDNPALAQQHGGDHYVSLPVQPVELIARNGWDFFAGSILQYLTRWRNKGGVADLRKALHMAHMRIELDGAIAPKFTAHMIRMYEFVDKNSIPLSDREALHCLEMWVLAGGKGTESRALFIAAIDRLITAAEGGRQGELLL